MKNRSILIVLLTAGLRGGLELPADRGHQNVANGHVTVWGQPLGILAQRRQLSRADQIEDRWLDQDDRGRVRSKQNGQVLRIEMVSMLVRHEYRVKIS